jgi:hypothetical protein
MYFGIVLSAGDAFLHCILNQAISDDAKETLSFIEKHTNEEKEELKHVLNIRLPQLIKANEDSAERIKILQMDPQIFVGGLSPHTTDQSLAMHFSPYGVIKEAKVIFNRKTRISKCYGFVTFANPQSALTAVMNANPIIDGKISNCNLASLKPSATRNKKRSMEPVLGFPGESVEAAAKRAKTLSGSGTQLGTFGGNPRNFQIKSYATKLKEQGVDVSEETVISTLEELKKTNPCKALHYFCEISEVLRGKPTFDNYSYELLHMAHHFRQTGEIKEFIKPEKTETSSIQLEGQFPEYIASYGSQEDGTEEYQMESHYTNQQAYQSLDMGISEGTVPGEERT